MPPLMGAGSERASTVVVVNHSTCDAYLSCRVAAQLISSNCAGAELAAPIMTAAAQRIKHRRDMRAMSVDHTTRRPAG